MIHRTPAAPSAAIAADRAATQTATWLRNIGIVVAGSLFIAACAHVSLPLYFTPVPLSMQPFAVMLLALLLAPRLAAATMVTYLVEGAAGLPFFAPGVAGTAGFAHLFGPTGGYLISYPFAALLISWMWRRSPRTYAWALAAAAAGSIVILAVGATWLGILTHASPRGVMDVAVLPFLPGDALKIAAATGIAVGAERLRRPSSDAKS
ncbi:MAG TPA: biotin transporter BioY [Terracidiphilus sp.]|nr:biotin transporter BioY [Terracidiphilus sp.]